MILIFSFSNSTVFTVFIIISTVFRPAPTVSRPRPVCTVFFSFVETYEPSMPLVVLGRRRLTMADSRRRVRGKQLTHAAYVLPSPALRAIADEGFCELRALQEDARRQHYEAKHM